MYRVRVEDTFAAAHFLAHYHGKCERLHGHNYRVRVYAEGDTLDRGGMLVDFGILKGALKETLAAMDHSLLNDLPPFAEGNPSAELIAKHIYDGMSGLLPDVNLTLVEVFETEKNCAGYLPDRPRP